MRFSEYIVKSFSKPVGALSDRPVMSAQELKAWFDSNSSNELKTSVNGIAALLDSNKGAENIGCKSYKEFGSNVEKFMQTLADRVIIAQSGVNSVREMINTAAEAAVSAQRAAESAMKYAERANDIANKMNWLVLIDPESGEMMGIQEILYRLYYHGSAFEESTCDIWDEADWTCAKFDTMDFTCRGFDTDNIFA